MLNRIFLHGRLTKDPEIRQTNSGIYVCKFTVAVDGMPNKSGEKKTDFIECAAWRQTAELVSKYFTKGSAIIVEGSLHNNNFDDKNGTKHYSYVVTAEQVHFAESKKTAEQKPNIGSFDEFEEIEVISDGAVPF